jgi:hypothetical protein
MTPPFVRCCCSVLVLCRSEFNPSNVWSRRARNKQRTLRRTEQQQPALPAAFEHPVGRHAPRLT